jgi:hypothetical protein
MFLTLLLTKGLLELLPQNARSSVLNLTRLVLPVKSCAKAVVSAHNRDMTKATVLYLIPLEEGLQPCRAGAMVGKVVVTTSLSKRVPVSNGNWGIVNNWVHGGI